MAFGSKTVAHRDVEFNVNLGKFRAELGEAANVYARTTGSMSTEALKLSVAEERVARAIKRHGAESLQARSATAALRRETESLGVASSATRDRLLAEERAMGRFTRGALAGSGAFQGLGRALAFSSAAFLGGAGLIYALRASVDAAKEQEVALGQLQVALRDSGLGWTRYRGQIEEALQAQVKTTGFTDNELTSSLAAFVRRFGDVNQALKANAIAADVARAKNISLADAQTLIMRASFGNPRSLRILAIELTKTTANYDALRASTKHASSEQIAAAKAADLQANELTALDAVNAKYHGNAAKFLTTSAGKQALFNAELDRSKEIIGAALLPELNKLLGGLSNYLEKLNSTGKLEKDVHKVTRDLADAAHGVGDAFHIIRAALSPVNTILGGTKHSVELLTLALVALKVKGLLGISGAAKTAAVETEAVGARLGVLAALGPIDVPIIVTLTLAAGGAALLAKLERWGGGGISRFFGGSPQEGPKRPLNKNGYPDVSTWTDAEKAAFAAQHGPGTADFYQKHPDIEMQVIKAGLAQEAHAGRNAGSVHRAAGFGGGTDTRTKRPAGLVLGLTEAQQTALYRAEGTPGSADDRAALNKQLSIYNALLGQKGLNAEQTNALLQGRNSVTDQLASIGKQGESAAKKAAAERAKRRAKLIEGLTQAPIGLRTAVETALANNASEDKLLALYRKERAAIEHQITELRKINAGKDAILKARTNEAAIQKRIDTVTGKKRGSGKDFFEEAAAEFKLYGSNVAQRFGDPLSGQDARGLLGQIALLLRDSNHHAAATARHTKTIVKTGPSPIGEARAAAGFGY